MTPVDLAASSTGPEIALLVRDSGGAGHVLDWKAGADRTSVIADLPAGFEPRAIASHPARRAFFVSGTIAGKSQILSLTTDGSAWHSAVIFESASEISRLIVGPRPFQTADSIRYRLFFAEQLPDGGSSLRSVTETGKIEYQVAGPTSSAVEFKNLEPEERPVGTLAPSAAPMTFHPRGQPLVWQDRGGCVHALPYGDRNWARDSTLSALPCGGSLRMTPNGAAYVQWRSGEPGVTVIRDDGRAIGRQATGYTFVSAPVTVPDGKGVIGIVSKGGAGSSIVYAPIAMPLADVANAWQLVGNACDEQLLTKNAGLFRERPNSEQLYSLYESYNYDGGGGPPFLVTTDLLWENFGAAFNGVFIALERRRAIDAFWAFVDAANAALIKSPPATMPGTRWANVFAALAAVHLGVATGEAGHIANDTVAVRSTVVDSVFNFAELRPRGHYTSSPEMKVYFRAVHYLTVIGQGTDASALSSLPPDVQQKANAWIDVYRPFIAQSRAKLVWSAASPVAPYARHPWDHVSVFPLSWGTDNETLESSVLHSSWPPDQQVARGLASGLDVATVFGSTLARSLDHVADIAHFGPVLDRISASRPRIADSSNLYDKWLNALSVEWADSATFPGAPPSSPVWPAKRLQTGLASWATLREATILVNERPSGAEAGEGGFEELIREQPRGYVEPAPKTFEAIAVLYDALAKRVAASSDLGVGASNTRSGQDEPLRQGILKRLAATAATTRSFERMAEKELRGEALTDSEYAAIRDIGGTAEHDFLVYKSLGAKDEGIPKPDPLPKIADVAGDPRNGLLEAAVGGPLEWRQIAPYFGRRQIVVGSVYSYYEFESHTPYDNERWRKEIDTHARPAWVQPLIAPTDKQCRAAASR